MKPLILCADDFAVHAAASAGIVALAQAGRLSATSVMVLSPRWAVDAAALRELRGTLDVGLHLDWTSEFAVAAGHGASLARVMAQAVVGKLTIAAARAEIERQLDAFEAHWQAAPDHVDGHQHVQQFAGVREALTDALAARYPAGSRPYLRVSEAKGGGLKTAVITAMGAAALRRRAQAAGITCSPALAGVYDFSSDGVAYAARMRGWLRDAPAGSIIMCHPAVSVVESDVIGAARVAEFAYLSSADFAHDCTHAGVQLSRGAVLKSL